MRVHAPMRPRIPCVDNDDAQDDGSGSDASRNADNWPDDPNADAESDSLFSREGNLRLIELLMGAPGLTLSEKRTWRFTTPACSLCGVVPPVWFSALLGLWSGCLCNLSVRQREGVHDCTTIDSVHRLGGERCREVLRSE